MRAQAGARTESAGKCHAEERWTANGATGSSRGHPLHRRGYEHRRTMEARSRPKHHHDADEMTTIQTTMRLHDAWKRCCTPEGNGSHVPGPSRSRKRSFARSDVTEVRKWRSVDGGYGFRGGPYGSPYRQLAVDSNAVAALSQSTENAAASKTQSASG
ncbi:hypothetical protein SKAU_G00413890 [Synaphobranchus kaupii]|uniref:Uncharacterized protein n=1 Tax=Synaphobranchus kaupii TaxID=118154 RepID=A0A9Q1E713_SYNKA|nr:hypothetical protein SKAU_G00413890 [Synaphobranchus kaupii]